MSDEALRSSDPAVQHLLKKAMQNNIETAWDRFDAMQTTCAFGDLGLCCRNCMLGPCRIDPFGEGPRKGICGISADGIVARNLCRMVTAGASSHSDHASHILEVLEKINSGGSTNFKIKDPAKLSALALEMGINLGGQKEITRALINKIKEAYSVFFETNSWLSSVVPPVRLKRLQDLGLSINGIDPIIRETMHRTLMGVDADPFNLLLGAIKSSIADFLGMDIATNLSDVVLGTPVLSFSEANLGVLDKDAVNIAVHGHNPLIAESLIQAMPNYQEKAKAAGASHGINMVGVCCTGNEILMRHKIPLATNAASQEIAILTGAIDAMVVDVQCVMPSLASVSECFHTKLITTMPIAKIPGANHMEFNSKTDAGESAGKIMELAINSFKNRDPKKVDIPDVKHEAMVGFSLESILSILKKINNDDPLQPIIDKIVSGDIYGVVLFAGCNNYKVPQDSGFITLAKMLAADNILLLATGCGAGAFAKHGYLSPKITNEICGEKLKKILNDLGAVSGINRPLPPVWHMGSCADNSRAARLVFALSKKLNVDVDKLPVVASAPEPMSEKAVAIGTWAVAMGITTHLGVVPPILGSKNVLRMLTEDIKGALGSKFIIEQDMPKAYQAIKATIAEKRTGLGLS